MSVTVNRFSFIVLYPMKLLLLCSTPSAAQVHKCIISVPTSTMCEVARRAKYSHSNILSKPSKKTETSVASRAVHTLTETKTFESCECVGFLSTYEYAMIGFARNRPILQQGKTLSYFAHFRPHFVNVNAYCNI